MKIERDRLRERIKKKRENRKAIKKELERLLRRVRREYQRRSPKKRGGELCKKIRSENVKNKPGRGDEKGSWKTSGQAGTIIEREKGESPSRSCRKGRFLNPEEKKKVTTRGNPKRPCHLSRKWWVGPPRESRTEKRCRRGENS